LFSVAAAAAAVADDDDDDDETRSINNTQAERTSPISTVLA